MKTSVDYPREAGRLLTRFEEISVKENVESIRPLQSSIQVNCKCGCQMVQHFAVGSERPINERFFVCICDRHDTFVD